MFLLSGHSLTPARKVPIESMSLSLRERDSTATIIPGDMTGIGLNSWLRSENNPGKNIVWRVKQLGTYYNENQKTVQLEHVVNALKDRLMFGEITAETITGRKGATECTAAQAARYILNQSDDWVLGSIDFSDSNPYKFDGDSLYDALETVTKTLDDAMWTYNMTVYPFKLNIVKKPEGVDSEMRASRNITSLSRTVDRSGMYTRMYPIGKDDLHISGDYVSKNEGTYGVISHVETDTSIDSKSALKAWAQERLKRHAQPVITIDVEGLELADATGETMDRFNINRICRIPLPEFGETITERITELNYPDVVHSPQVVRVTLSNASEDVTHLSLTQILTESAKKSAGGGRGAARQAKEDHAWFEDTDTRVSMVVGTRDGKNYIKAGEITLAINDAGEAEARIDAKHVWIGNKNSVTVIEGKCSLSDVTADYIQSKISSITNLQVRTLTATGEIYVGNSAGQSTSVRSMYASVEKKEVGNNITLKFTRLNGKSYASDSVTFSKATTLSSSWSSGVQTVTASPQGKTLQTYVDGGDEDWSNGNCTIPIRYSTNGGASFYGTGAYAYAHVTKSDISIPTSWSSSSGDPGADVKVSLNANYKYHKCTINVHGMTKTLRVYLIT